MKAETSKPSECSSIRSAPETLNTHNSDNRKSKGKVVSWQRDYLQGWKLSGNKSSKARARDAYTLINAAWYAG